MITCSIRREPRDDGTLDPSTKGFLSVRSETGDLVTIVIHPDNDWPSLRCNVTPQDARALALAILAGSQLATADYKV